MMLGELFITKGIADLIETKGITPNELMRCVMRHQRGDYGLLDSHDVAVNERNLNHSSGTVMSEYVISGHRVWIITTLSTDVENQYSTVLLPMEY
jgi:hypothetical protein